MIAGLEQHRRDFGAAQHMEGGETVRLGAQPTRPADLRTSRAARSAEALIWPRKARSDSMARTEPSAVARARAAGGFSACAKRAASASDATSDKE